MKTKLFLILTLLIISISNVYLPTGFTQDYTTWSLPEGAKSRLGKGSISEIKYSPDGKLLAVQASPGTWFYDAQSLEELTLLPIRGVIFSPDSRTFAVSSGQEVHLYDVETLQLTTTLAGHTSWITGIEYSPDGTILASGSADKTLRLWDATTGEVRSILTDHESFLFAFSPDGATLVNGDGDNSVIWNVATGERKAAFRLALQQRPPFSWGAMPFSPDGKRFVRVGLDKFVEVWNTETGFLETVYQGHTNLVYIATYSPDGQTIASAGTTGTIRLWDTATQQLRTTLTGHSAAILRLLKYSPDGTVLASGSNDGTVRLWDTATGQLKHILDYGYAIRAMNFSPDGSTLAGDGILWDVANG